MMASDQLACLFLLKGAFNSLSAPRGELVSESNQPQIDYWNGRAGEKWARLQNSLDVMLGPATAELKARAGPVSGQRVLDIGCGTGETCAIWLDGGAEVTGVDVSGPMLAVAADRTAGKATLVQADASVWMGDATFDLAVSRFGLMFFADPDVAFATIAANVRPGGRLLFTCWRAAAENQWVTTPMGAIRDLLPDSPPPAPHAPGPFALADRERLRGILERAGFANVSITPFDFPVCLASEGGVEPAVRFAMQIGPSGAALAGADPEMLAAAAQRLNAELAPHDRDGRVTLGGAIWLVEAIRSGSATDS
jgi:SAM-dependent methyltransferase